MSAVFVASWTGAGILVGAALAAYSRRLLTFAPSNFLATTPLTACAFGGLAWRFGHQFDLLPYTVLAAVGVALGLVDVVEQRLPGELVYSAAALVNIGCCYICGLAKGDELGLESMPQLDNFRTGTLSMSRGMTT